MADDATKTKPAGDTTNTTSSKGTKPSKPRKKRRWWLRILIGVPVLLIALVALLPTLLSIGVAQRTAVRMIVNDNIRGQVAIDDLSLGWFSSVKITGVHVTDNLHPETLTIGSIEWDKGLLGALLALRSGEGMNLGTIWIDGIDGVIYFNEDGSNSLQNAFLPREQPPATPSQPPTKPAPTAEPPSTPPPAQTNAPVPVAAGEEKPFAVQAMLTVKNSRVSLVQFDGRKVNVTDLNTVVDVNYPQGVTLTHTSTHDGGGKLLAEIKLQNLSATSGSVLDALTGTVKVHTEPAIDLAPAVTFFAPPGTKGQGSLTLDINSVFNPGTASGQYVISVQDLSLADDNIEVKSVTQKFYGIVGYKDRIVNGEIQSSGSIGTLSSLLTYNTAGPAALPENLADLLMQGKSFTAPDASLMMNGQLDLGALARALPGVVKLQEGVEIENGTLALDNIKAQGGGTPATDGKVTLTVAINRDGTTTPIQPVVLNWNVRTDEQGQLNINHTEVSSSFATAGVSGTANDLSGRFDADLTLLRQEVAKLVDLQDLELGGKVSGELAVQTDRADAKLRQLALSVDAASVVVGSRAEAEASQAGEPKTGEAENDGLTRIDAALEWAAALRYDEQKLDLNGAMSVGRLRLNGVNFLGDDKSPQPHPAELTHDITLDNREQRLDVRTFAFASAVLEIADFKGSVTQLDGDKVLNFTGSYGADWKELTALVERFKPGAMEGIVMRASSAGPIAVTGPVGAPTITPLAGSTRVGWGKDSRVYGIDFGDAKLEPQIAGGVFALPLAEIPANDGTLRLMSNVHLTGDEPVLKIPGQLHMMDQIAINADMGKYLLSRAVPLLAETTKLEGRVSLTVRDIDLPLGESMMQSGSGGGRLDLSAITLSPAGEIARLLTLVGLDASKSYPVTIGAVDFQLQKGALVYEHMTITVAGVEFRVRGQVRFDDGVDLIVSVPVKRELFEALGIKAATVAKIPEGLYVDVPLVGTRTQPKLDLGGIDKEALLKDALKGVGLDLGGTIGGILGGGNSTTQPATTQPADSTEKKPALPIKPLLDLLPKK